MASLAAAAAICRHCRLPRALFSRSIASAAAAAATHEKQEEVVILGAGIAGICTAHYILQASSDVSVRILDKSDGVAEGTSRKNGGLLCPSLSSSWTAFPLLFGSDAMTSMAIRNALSPKQRSQSLMKFDTKLLLDRRLWNFAFHWLRRRPYLQHQHRHIGAIMSYSMKCFDDPNDDVMQTLQYSRTAEGTRTRSGEIAETDSSGDIALFCHGLYDELVRRHGDRISFHPMTTVDGIDLNGGKIESVRVRDQKSSVTDWRADKVVIALGNGSYDICKKIGIQCPMLPCKGYIITFSSEIVVPFNLELSNKSFIAPFGNNKYHLSGFAEFLSTYNDNEHAFDIDSARVEVLVEAAKEVFPDLEIVDIDVGYRPLSPDDTPMIGQTRIGGVYLNTGAGSKGWTMGPACGKLLAAILLGIPTEVDPIEYSPNRFETNLLL